MTNTFRLSLAATMAVLSMPAANAWACSTSRFEPWRAEQATFFIVDATPDTLAATPGGRPFYSLDERRKEPITEPERRVSGQVLRLSRIGGFAADSIARVAERFGGEVVVVGWDTRGDCRPVPFGGHLVKPGRRALVMSAGLRAPEHWVGGRPTFDAGFRDAYLGVEEEYEPTAADSALTLDRLFGLLSVLPAFEEYEPDPEAAAAPLFRWVAANPDVRGSAPLREMLMMAYSFIDDVRVSRIIPPMAGTYRLRIVAAEGSPRELLIRTSSSPTPWSTRWFAGVDDDDIGPQPSDGYRLHASAAAEGTCARYSLAIVAEPSRTASGAEEWAADLDWGLLGGCLRGDAAIAHALAAYTAQVRGGSWDQLPGTFTSAPDGTIRFRQVLRANGRVLLEVSGERVSAETM
ncbi:MAG: hypothetical protein KY444_11505 [Gemmatimonadetes bacterium]|nr:hypothetical protein [Gemmatimonadota bacterium]